MKNSTRYILGAVKWGWALAALAVVSIPDMTTAHDDGPAHHRARPENATQTMTAFEDSRRQKLPLSSKISTTSAPAAECLSGAADADNGDAPYPCDGIDMQSFLALDDIGGFRSNSEANDIWGWTASDGSEYAIIGRVFGTSFIDITNPTNPVYLGDLPTHGAFGSSWRDVKVYGDHAYIVSEAKNHGMQVFDLTQLETMSRTSLPVTFSETAHYNSAAASHNVFINEDSGFAYMVGNSGKNSCSGGLHMVNLADPVNPSFAGCYSGDGYTHDVQCVNYNGPDADYAGREICFASNEDTVTIVDVTNKSNPVLISKMGYADAAYTHQGWLTDDQAYFIWDDELDEYNGGVSLTTTRIADVSDLDNPTLSSVGASNPNYNGAGVYSGVTTSIDHNLYMVGGCAVQANYRSGLRIVDFRDATGTAPAGVEVAEIAYFDIWPGDDNPAFNGMWSNYAFFPSGNIIASGIEQGLYVLKPTFDLAAACAPEVPVVNAAPNVTISTPLDGTSFTEAEFVAFTGSASDPESDPVSIATWSSSIDGEFGAVNSFSTDGLSVGDHIITATSTADTGGKTGSAVINISITPVGGGSDLWLSDLTGSVLTFNNKRYTGSVLITANGASGPVSDATVAGTWSGAANGTGSCATNSVGQCSVSKGGSRGQSMTFTVDTVTHGALTYNPALNTDAAFETIPSPP
jgi:choice-of-anchor B domain-containing protein